MADFVEGHGMPHSPELPYMLRGISEQHGAYDSDDTDSLIHSDAEDGDAERLYTPKSAAGLGTLGTPSSGTTAATVALMAASLNPLEDRKRNASDDSGSTPDPEAVKRGSRGSVGRVWHIHVVPDEYFDARHCDKTTRELKPRRPLPQIRSSQFFDRVVRRGDQWIYEGEPINGWPALRQLEVVRVNGKVRKMLSMAVFIKRFWDAERKEDRTKKPFFPPKLRYVRVTLRAPLWSGVGWTPDSRGFFFWSVLQDGSTTEQPKLHVYHGEDMIRAVKADAFTSHLGDVSPRDCQAVRVHVLAHRYAKPRESPTDLVTYHAALFIEWDHGRHGTIFELAWWNGLGGYGGKSNWYHDRNKPITALYAGIPDCMKAPFVSRFSELRALDVPMRNKEELQSYLAQYTGHSERFLSPEIFLSGDVALSHRSQLDIMRCLLNYSARSPDYHQESRNCQTFAADFFGYLTGKRVVEPYHQVCRILYKPRRHYFMYGPEL